MTILYDYRDAIDELVPGTHPVEAEDQTAMQNKAVAKAMACRNG